MRQLAYTVLSQNVALQALVADRIYTDNTLGTDPIPARPPTPFIIVAEQPNYVYQEVRKTSKSVNQVFDFRCYDQRGDYLKLDTMCRLVRDILLGVEQQRSPSGALCIDVRWIQTGIDSEDPDLDLILKTVTMRFVTNI